MALNNATFRTSHTRLLKPVPLVSGRTADLDAIIVPSARHSLTIVHAARLASRLDCMLIVLTSRKAWPWLVRLMLRAFGVARSYVLDFPTDVSDGLPALASTGVLARAGLARDNDVSVKRNIGLAVAYMAGLHRTLFLDDDVRVADLNDLRGAAALLREHDAVGLDMKGWYDNSVVCHANRAVGEEQKVFVGAGALLVAADRINSFFPDVYNEDWLFLLDHEALLPVAIAGQAAQRWYDPFENEERARREEFGDALGEGLFSMIEDGGKIKDADLSYWRSFLADRRRFIERILNKLPGAMDQVQAARVARSLLAARDEHVSRVTPELCVEYLAAWRRDLDTWAEFREGLPTGLSVDRAVEMLRRKSVTSLQPSPVCVSRALAG